MEVIINVLLIFILVSYGFEFFNLMTLYFSCVVDVHIYISGVKMNALTQEIHLFQIKGHCTPSEYQNPE